MAVQTFEQIRADIRAKKYSPCYLLMGDEPYFIDLLTQALVDSVVPEEEKDFNQYILYGAETDVPAIINVSRNFPMMSDLQLVVVKEAQNLTKIDELDIYLKNPSPHTILVLNYKNGSIDKRKKLVSAFSEKGVLFESKRVQDYKLPSFIVSFVQDKGLSIDQKSSQLLADYLGNDLNKIANEIEKLLIVMPSGQKRITPELIEKNIGISKDYNNFELLKAVVNKDLYKAIQIAIYFEKNPKNNPLIVTLSVLFNFFFNLMPCYWLKDRSEQSVATELNLKNPYQAKDYITAATNYNAFKAMEIIGLLREYDAKSKGVGNHSTPDGQLLQELLLKIIH